MSCRLSAGERLGCCANQRNLQPLTKGAVAGHPGLLASPSCFEKPLVLQFPGSLQVSFEQLLTRSVQWAESGSIFADGRKRQRSH